MTQRPSFRLFVVGNPLASTDAASSPLVALAEFGGARAIERVNLSAAWLETQARNVADLRSFLEDGTPEIDLPRLRAIGQHLFDPFVTGGVRALFQKSAGGPTGSEDELLPCEVFVESGAAAEWPWEFLYDPGARQFLCEAFHPVSRGVFTQTLPRIQPLHGRKLAILVVLGTQRDDASADAEEQRKAIQNVFHSYLGTGNVTLDVLQGVTPQELARALGRNRYGIVHYFGHGGFDAGRGEGFLALSHRNGEASLSASDLAATLVGRGIQLVFLNACETGRADPRFAPAQSAMASVLVDRGIPAVIATQFAMPETGSHAFAAFVYRSLFDGQSLSCAMREGRLGIRYDEAAESVDWGIPVLYTADPHLKLFAKPERPPAWSATLDAALGREPGATHAPARPPSSTTAPAVAAAAGEDGARTRSSGQSVVDRLRGALTPSRPDRKQRAAAKEPVRMALSQGQRAAGREPVRIALCDIDAKAAFLPEIAAAANAAQSYFTFAVEFLPVPAGSSVRKDGVQAHTLVLPRVEQHLARTPDSFRADLVCCLTRQLVDNGDIGGLFASSLGANRRVLVVSTYGVREYAAEAGVSFSGATFMICLSMIAAVLNDIDFHHETAGCLFDYCEVRHDIVIGLKKRRFDHEPCRDRIRERDPAQLAAIDALVAATLVEGGAAERVAKSP